jgi:predicted tellurium resistance membrane protein TerC
LGGLDWPRHAIVVLDFLDDPQAPRGHDEGGDGWSIFYIALPLAFGAYIWSRFGSETGVEYLTGYLVEKSLSVDNLFVFMLLLAAFAVPKELQQRVLLFGIVGALVLARHLHRARRGDPGQPDLRVLLFRRDLLITAVKILRDQRSGHGQEVDVSSMRVGAPAAPVHAGRADYRGRAVHPGHGRRATPLALVVVRVRHRRRVRRRLGARRLRHHRRPVPGLRHQRLRLLGLRALYFVLQGALSKLVHLGYGLAAILGFIGVKLVLHWAHDIWKGVPEIPTVLSLVVIVVVLAITTFTSLRTTKRAEQRAAAEGTSVDA